MGKWLETPKDDEAAKQSKQMGRAGRAVVEKPSISRQPIRSTALYRPDAGIGASEKPQSIPTLTAATEPHTAPSQPVAPQAAERKPASKPRKPPKSRNRPKQRRRLGLHSFFGCGNSQEILLLHCIQTLMFHLFAFVKQLNQNGIACRF